MCIFFEISWRNIYYLMPCSRVRGGGIKRKVLTSQGLLRYVFKLSISYSTTCPADLFVKNCFIQTGELCSLTEIFFGSSGAAEPEVRFIWGKTDSEFRLEHHLLGYCPGKKRSWIPLVSGKWCQQRHSFQVNFLLSQAPCLCVCLQVLHMNERWKGRDKEQVHISFWPPDRINK